MTTKIFSILTGAAIFTILFSSCTTSRYANNYEKAAKDINEYYYGPVRQGDYVYSLFKTPIDYQNLASQDFGLLLLGGFVLSNEMAYSDEYIGVIVMDLNMDAIALSVKKDLYTRYLNNYITLDTLIAGMQYVEVDKETWQSYLTAGSN
jgi:hypothetical protein